MDSPGSKRRTQSSSGALQGSRLLKKDRYRIVVMGAAGVGKTCIISRLMYRRFLSEYKATIEDLHSESYEINGIPLTLDILDTSGTYEFPGMRRLSISTGDAFLLVYSVDDVTTFEEVQRMRQQIITEKNDKATPIVIIGNKTDIEVQKRIANPTAEEWGAGFLEVSAKNDLNLTGIFRELLAQVNVHLDKIMTEEKTGAECSRRFSFRRRSSRRKSPRSNRASCQVS